MKKSGILIAGLLLSSSTVYATGNNNQHAAVTGSDETVTMMVVDKTRKPFKRSFETYTVTEIAALEEARNSNMIDSRDRMDAKRISWR